MTAISPARQSEPSSRSFFLLCLTSFAVAVLAVAWISHGLGIPFLPVDSHGGIPYPRNPAVSTAETAKYFWRTGSLGRPEFRALHDYFLEQSRQHPEISYTPDVYARTLQGGYLPKHPWIVSVLAAPFFGVFGEPGLWFFNQAALFLLLAAEYQLARRFAGRLPALMVCLLTAGGTNLLWQYSYTFSYDVFGAACVLGGAALLGRMNWLGGLLLACGLYVRVTNGMLYPFLFFAAYGLPLRVQGWRSALVGLGLGVLPLLGYNTWYFHAPLSGPYAQVYSLVAGQEVSDYGSHLFSMGAFVREIGPRLFDHQDGLLWKNPVLMAALLLVPLALGDRTPDRGRLACLLAGAGVMGILLLCFNGWLGSAGYRYWMPSTVLFCLSFAPVLERIIPRSCPPFPKSC